MRSKKNKKLANKRRTNVRSLVEGEGKRKSGVVMGTDASKSELACCIINDTEILFERVFANTKKGIKKIIKVLETYNVESTAFESTASYHYKLMFALLEANQPVLLANPLETKNTQGKKTDKLDARRIAIAHRDGRLHPSVIPPKDLMDLRRSTRTLLRLTTDTTKSKQRLNKLFHYYDFTLHKTKKNLLKSKWSLNLLQQTITKLAKFGDLSASTEVRSKQCNDIHKMIEQLVFDLYPGIKTGKKPKTDPDVILVIEEMTSLATSSSGMDRVAMFTELSQIQLFTSLIEQQRAVYLDYANSNPTFLEQMKLLISIPGIGPDTAAILLAEIVDINYFSSANKLAKWAGLAPKVSQSGHRKRTTGKLHKGGNKYVRRALTLAVKNIYARGDDTHPIRQFVKQLYEKKGKHGYWLAICAGARKLGCVIHVMLSRHEEWQPPTITDSVVIAAVKSKVDKKIKALQRSVKRLENVSQKITQAIDQQLNIYSTTSFGVRDSKKALNILLQAV